MDRSITPLIVPEHIVVAMIAHAKREAPLECCGLLSGANRRVETIHELANEAQSETEYLVTIGLFEPFKRMRETGEELIAIYHSHPAAPAVPSKRDLVRNHYGDAIHVIVSLAGLAPDVKAYRLEENTYTQVKLEVQSSRTRMA